MDRRDFMKLCGAAGLAVMAPGGGAFAQDAPTDDRFWVFVHATGGWDPTSLCDPKGRANEEEENPMNMYFKDDIGEAVVALCSPQMRYLTGATIPLDGGQANFD